MSGRRVRIGTVWDRTVDVLQGRGGMLFALALGFMIVPTLVANVAGVFAGASVAGRGVAGIVGIAASLLMLAGLLAITAAASDPRVDARDATATGLVRLGPAVGLLLIVAVAAMLVVLPIAAIVFYSGASYDPTTGAINISRASGGGIAVAGLLALIGFLAGLWISAKLVPLFAVIVNERRGIGALRRSFALTRGGALRLIGVLILFGIVSVVAVSAATTVVGVVARLILGADSAASVALIVATVNSVVTALASVVQMVFSAQYYVAAQDADAVAGEG
jgi:hypothetical protein